MMWFTNMFLRLLGSLWAAQAMRVPTAPVLVSNGLLRGSIARSGTHAYYLGIPYATVQEKFQAPGPEPQWDRVFEAVNGNVRCRQALTLQSGITWGQDDCLILNIFTPLYASSEDPLPVMVYIHGGSFSLGSSSTFVYGPEYLVTKNIVLVTINYRLAAQGFLCLGIKEAPGNAGMKDQVAALRWVQKNIRKFGGDPDNVTIVGESSGAASVSLHVLSPMSKGLFHKAIVQSGSSISGWVFQYEPIKMASLQAKEMGFDSMDPRKLYKFLMGRSDTELLVTKLPREEGTTNTQSEIIYSPCAEKHIDGEEPFLTDLPYNILIKGNFNKVPMIIGSNSEEGLVFAAWDDMKFYNKVDFEKALPHDLEFPSSETQKAVAKRVKELYLGDREVSKEALLQVSKLYGEPYNNFGPVEETNLIVRSSDQPVWHYLFGYSGNRNLFKAASGLRFLNKPGATHADELLYLFSQPIIPTLYEKDMIERMTTMWTNFIKYGDPTPTTSKLLPVKWPAVKPDDQRALYIDKKFKIVPLWYTESLLYWREVYAKYRRKYDPNTAY